MLISEFYFIFLRMKINAFLKIYSKFNLKLIGFDFGVHISVVFAV